MLADFILQAKNCKKLVPINNLFLVEMEQKIGKQILDYDALLVRPKNPSLPQAPTS